METTDGGRSSVPRVRSTSLGTARWLSTFGAASLAAGLALVAGDRIEALTWPLLMTGGLVHAFGMWRVQRLESASELHVTTWEKFVTGSCWAALLALGAILTLNLLW